MLLEELPLALNAEKLSLVGTASRPTVPSRETFFLREGEFERELRPLKAARAHVDPMGNVADIWEATTTSRVEEQRVVPQASKCAESDRAILDMWSIVHEIAPAFESMQVQVEDSAVRPTWRGVSLLENVAIDLFLKATKKHSERVEKPSMNRDELEQLLAVLCETRELITTEQRTKIIGLRGEEPTTLEGLVHVLRGVQEMDAASGRCEMTEGELMTEEGMAEEGAREEPTSERAQTRKSLLESVERYATVRSSDPRSYKANAWIDDVGMAACSLELRRVGSFTLHTLANMSPQTLHETFSALDRTTRERVISRIAAVKMNAFVISANSYTEAMAENDLWLTKDRLDEMELKIVTRDETSRDAVFALAATARTSDEFRTAAEHSTKTDGADGSTDWCGAAEMNYIKAIWTWGDPSLAPVALHRGLCAVYDHFLQRSDAVDSRRELCQLHLARALTKTGTWKDRSRLTLSTLLHTRRDSSGVEPPSSLRKAEGEDEDENTDTEDGDDVEDSSRIRPTIPSVRTARSPDRDSSHSEAPASVESMSLAPGTSTSSPYAAASGGPRRSARFSEVQEGTRKLLYATSPGHSHPPVEARNTFFVCAMHFDRDSTSDADSIRLNAMLRHTHVDAVFAVGMVCQARAGYAQGDFSKRIPYVSSMRPSIIALDYNWSQVEYVRRCDRYNVNWFTGKIQAAMTESGARVFILPNFIQYANIDNNYMLELFEGRAMFGSLALSKDVQSFAAYNADKKRRECDLLHCFFISREESETLHPLVSASICAEDDLARRGKGNKGWRINKNYVHPEKAFFVFHRPTDSEEDIKHYLKTVSSRKSEPDATPGSAAQTARAVVALPDTHKNAIILAVWKRLLTDADTSQQQREALSDLFEEMKTGHQTDGFDKSAFLSRLEASIGESQIKDTMSSMQVTTAEGLRTMIASYWQQRKINATVSGEALSSLQTRLNLVFAELVSLLVESDSHSAVPADYVGSLEDVKHAVGRLLPGNLARFAVKDIGVMEHRLKWGGTEAAKAKLVFDTEPVRSALRARMPAVSEEVVLVLTGTLEYLAEEIAEATGKTTAGSETSSSIEIASKHLREVFSDDYELKTLDDALETVMPPSKPCAPAAAAAYSSSQAAARPGSSDDNPINLVED